MFGRPFRIGRLFGIELTVSWSFLALVAVFALISAQQVGNVLLGVVIGTLSLALIAASVLAHELGHSLVARHLGYRIAEIELHFFGGAAKMLDMPRRPRHEVLIAAAGPAVSFVLAGIFLAAGAIGVEALGVLGGLASINLILGGFNLIPALPTDGGRILRALLSERYGHLEATRLAVKVARVATVGLGLYALLPGGISAIAGVAIAIFLWMLSTRELQMAEMLHGRSRSQPSYSPGAEDVEVFDRAGRFVGRAPGGAEPISRGVGPAAAPQWRYQDPASARPAFGRRVIHQSPDGRIWIVTQP